ncbi:MAG: hypothetical protein ACERKD_07455 [Prolixibacteraceae bacterium]
MKKIFPTLIVLIFLLAVSGFCYSQEENLANKNELVEDNSSSLLTINASQYGMKYRETQILMQNRMGIRIEYTLDRGALELWISPQAGKSQSYVDRNWSNRDDHTSIFDRILIPGCDLSKFKYCDWDPFHSILYFEDQTLHIAQIYNQPAVLVWFEKEGLVDFKIYGTEEERSEKSFIINHSSRERDFQSAAILGEGDGYFQQQMQLDKHRSIYTRAHMAPNQVLLIASELNEEKIGGLAQEWVKQPIEKILAQNEALIAKDLNTGKFILKDRIEMQKLLDKSRRVALSMQDFNGIMRSTNQYIYYLMWFRDGGMNTAHLAYSGWSKPAYDQISTTIQNPNFTNEKPDEVFFGQMFAGPHTKWQEDGLFYNVWPAFSYWTQTGDKSLFSDKNLEVFDKAMQWLENRTFNEEKGLFGRYFYCETPMTGSRDDGWDNVTGAPTNKWGSEYEGKTIVRSYDNYINMLNYSVYIMLSSVHSNKDKAKEYYQKALDLEKNMKQFFEYNNVLPSYGLLETQEGDFIEAKPYGMDIWDYVWGLSLPPFEINQPATYQALREQLRKDMTTTEVGYFHCVYFAALTAMDTELHSEDSIMAAMDKLVPMSSAPGKYLPMPYAVPEMFNISEENPFHDVRPLVYSIAPWLSAVTNLGLHRLPFGIAARGTKYLEQLENYEYKGALIDVHFDGSGSIANLTLNGKSIKHSLQIPENMLISGDNSLTVSMQNNALTKNSLVASTVQLKAISENETKVVFDIQAYGKNVLTFKNLSKKIKINSANGKRVKVDKSVLNGFTYFEFVGKGNFFIEMQ